MHISESSARRVGLIAWVAALAGTVLGPLHALSRFATVDGQEDLDSAAVRAWAEPAARLLRPLLDWSDPGTVYRVYSMAWFLIFLAATACAFTVHGRRAPTGAEKWGWRVALTGYLLATASTFGDYWTPWTDQSFLILGIPGTLVSLAGSTLLGITLLRRRFRPRVTGWLLATWIPLLFLLSSLVAMGAAALPMIWAWALAGRALGRSVPGAGRGDRGVPDLVPAETGRPGR